MRTSHRFYDYQAKYIDGSSQLVVPAVLSDKQKLLITEIAVRAFKALDLAGPARVDFLVERAGGKVILNEVNTMPGFTSISMYPRLWAATGLPYDRLLTKLIELGLERYREKKSNTTTIETSEWFA